LINSLWSEPGMDKYIESGLTELANVNALVGGGEKTAEEARELLFSFAEATGVPPHLTGALALR
jgi:hypothetical protein